MDNHSKRNRLYECRYVEALGGCRTIGMKVKLDVKSIPQIKQSRGLEERGRVQQMIDSEVSRLMTPYTPRDTGALINSATRLTQIGSGLVKQGGPSAPYARRWYYNKEGAHFVGGKTDHWFNKAMRNGGVKEILKKAQQMIGDGE